MTPEPDRSPRPPAHHEAHAFVDRWLSAWNSADIEAVLELWTDDLNFSSPLAQALTGAPTVTGREAAATYWSRALARAPAFRFELDTVLVDPTEGALTILYWSITAGVRKRAAEVIWLAEDGAAFRGVALYGAEA